jgi:hypothetical protein
MYCTMKPEREGMDVMGHTATGCYYQLDSLRHAACMKVPYCEHDDEHIT